MDTAMTIRTETITPVLYGIAFHRLKWETAEKRARRTVPRLVRRWADRHGKYAGYPMVRAERDYRSGELLLSVLFWTVPDRARFGPAWVEHHLAYAGFRGGDIEVFLG